MRTRIIEATNGPKNWGKFLLGLLDTDERTVPSSITGQPVVDRHEMADKVWVLDLATGEGAAYDLSQPLLPQLERHQIWVCLLYEPLLAWLQAWLRSLQPDPPAPQVPLDLAALPALIDLPEVTFGLVGYRRTGPSDWHKELPASGDVIAQVRKLCPNLRVVR